jgi:polyribonucleotide nucleotidyltransferase
VKPGDLHLLHVSCFYTLINLFRTIQVKRGFLHYDFPDFSTGTIKTKAGGAANRRAIGHGNLAERAILPVMPRPDDFPYSIRLTCEVTSSNGSSSMASACAATLSMLDAGVPLTAPVAGVSVGLASDSQKLLLDITGTEDHFGM